MLKNTAGTMAVYCGQHEWKRKRAFPPCFMRKFMMGGKTRENQRHLFKGTCFATSIKKTAKIC